MKDALKLLGDFQFKLPGHKNRALLENFRNVATQKDASTLWRPFKINPDHPYDEKLDDARRKVLWYFKKAHLLYKHGFLPKKLMKIITNTNGYPLLFDLVWPITKVRHLAEIGEKKEDIAKELKRFDWFREMQTNFPPEVD